MTCASRRRTQDERASDSRECRGGAERRSCRRRGRWWCRRRGASGRRRRLLREGASSTSTTGGLRTGVAETPGQRHLQVTKQRREPKRTLGRGAPAHPVLPPFLPSRVHVPLEREPRQRRRAVVQVDELGHAAAGVGHELVDVPRAEGEVERVRRVREEARVDARLFERVGGRNVLRAFCSSLSEAGPASICRERAKKRGAPRCPSRAHAAARQLRRCSTSPSPWSCRPGTGSSRQSRACRAPHTGSARP